MKKNLLIACTLATALGLSAFGYKNWEPKEATATKKTICAPADPFAIFQGQLPDIDLYYNVAPRFMTTVTKEQLSEANSIIDILPPKATHLKESFENVEVENDTWS